MGAGERRQRAASANRGRSAAGLGLFALSPVPSGQLFVAAGLMTVELVPVRERAGTDTVVLEMPTALWPAAASRFEDRGRHTPACGSPPVCDREPGGWIEP